MRIQCPSCSKLLEAPDEKAGQVVKCSACGAQMQLPTLPASKPAAPRPGGGMPVGPGAGAAGAGTTKACRFCGEQILAVAQKCKHCGSYLTGPRAGRRPGRGSGAGSNGMAIGALICGILGLVFCQILGPVAIILGAMALKKGENRGMAIGGLVLGIIDTVILLLVGVLMIIGMMAESGGY